MSYFEAILLGLVQGITEFLPISSSGHLVLLESVMHLKVDELKGFDVAMHLATLLAILIYFRKDLLRFEWWPKLAVATIPAVVVGLFLEDKIDSIFRGALSVSILMIIVGLLFLIPQKKEGKPLDWKRTLLIGGAQALAIIPGVSRSGVTIFTGIHLGMKRTEAARFSFLLGSIAIAGAGLLKALEGNLFDQPLTIMLTGFLAAFVSSLFAVVWLMKFLEKHGLKPFGIYRIALGVFLLAGFFLSF